jgi:hypothetical protein
MTTKSIKLADYTDEQLEAELKRRAFGRKLPSLVPRINWDPVIEHAQGIVEDVADG